jgi:hypothetical protein
MKEIKLPPCWVVFHRAPRAKKWLPSLIRVTAAAGSHALWDQVNNGPEGHHLLMRVAGWKAEPTDLPARVKPRVSAPSSAGRAPARSGRGARPPSKPSA